MKIGLLGVSFVSFLILLAQTPLRWPFELFASFQPQFLVLAALTCLLAAYWYPRRALATAFIVSLTIIPILTFTKFQTPSSRVCAPNNCLTVMTANLRGMQTALSRVAEVAVQENVDLLSLNQMPGGMTNDRLLDLFPSYTSVFLAVPEEIGAVRGKPIALLSRIEPSEISGELPDDTGGRAMIVADYEIKGNSLRVIVLHPVIPLSQAGMRKRNNLLAAAGRSAIDSSTTILMGDFNLTPWAPAFRALPGERAGDPRFGYSWDATRPLYGIMIDHILFKGDLTLMAAKTLEPTGSDHRPVLALFEIGTK